MIIGVSFTEPEYEGTYFLALKVRGQAWKFIYGGQSSTPKKALLKILPRDKATRFVRLYNREWYDPESLATDMFVSFSRIAAGALCEEELPLEGEPIDIPTPLGIEEA